MTADLVTDLAQASTDAPAAEPKARKAPKLTKVAESAAAPAAKAAKAPTLGKAAQIDARARSGILPPAPDFSAPTHKGDLKKHSALVAAANSFGLAAPPAGAMASSIVAPERDVLFSGQSLEFQITIDLLDLTLENRLRRTRP